jgi:DNA-directed RNA polymerase subunit M/transcription elongation factor TFIIS
MYKPESSTNETVSGDYGTTEHSASDIANGRRAPRKLALAVTVTCPNCGFSNKPEWLNKSRKGDSYATTMFCEQCGSLLAIWALHVEARIVAQKQE